MNRRGFLGAIGAGLVAAGLRLGLTPEPRSENPWTRPFTPQEHNLFLLKNGSTIEVNGWVVYDERDGRVIDYKEPVDW